MAGWVLAVDFGTTSTAAAIRVNGAVQRVTIDGALSMPSMVFWREGTGPPGTGRLVLGQDADEGLGLAPWCVERTPKRRIGDELILLGERGQVELRVTDVVGQILAKVISEAVLARGGQRPAELRLTHPARWGEHRLQKLREAAAIAGFESPVLISEPVAAATHFASERLSTGQHVAVYDLGGGTFDTAVLQRTESSFALAGPPGGLEQLGGEDFDYRLYQHLGGELPPDQWQALQAPTERVWTQANRELLRNARRTKEALSRNPDYEFLVGYPINRTLTVTAQSFQELIADSIADTVRELAGTIRNAGLEPTDLAAIYLAGGSSKIPLVKQMIQHQLGQTPETLDDPKAVTALGAARVPGAATEAHPVTNGGTRATVATAIPGVRPTPDPDPDPEPTPLAATVLDPHPEAAQAATTALDPKPAPARAPTQAGRRTAAPREPVVVTGSGVWRQLPAPLMVLGCLALAGDTFLKWNQLNFWTSEPSLHAKAAFGVAWGAVIVLSVLTARRSAGALSRLAGAAGLFLAGGAICWPLDYTSFHPIGVGTYLGLVCAAVIALGGLIAALEPGPALVAQNGPAGWLSRAPGAPIIFAGCLALAGDSFLHVLFGRNFWQLESSLHLKVAMACFVAAAMAASLLAAVRATVSRTRLAGAAGAFAAGAVFFVLTEGTSYSRIGIGTYLGIAIALLVAVGGLSALLRAGGERGPSTGGERPSFTAGAATRSPDAPATTIPADWYPDPVRGHGQRRWDGSRWTDEVR